MTGVLHTMPDDTWGPQAWSTHVRAPFRLVHNSAPFMPLSELNPERPPESLTYPVHLDFHGYVCGQANYSVPPPSPLSPISPTLIVMEWALLGMRAITIAYGYIFTQLTHDACSSYRARRRADRGQLTKEDGVAIEIGGKKLALGIPGA